MKKLRDVPLAQVGRVLVINVLMAFSIASNGWAVTFRDPASGFSLEIEGQGGKPCFLRPEAMRTDSAACEGLNIGAAAKTLSQDVRLFTFMRYDGWGYSLNGAWQSNKVAGIWSKEIGNKFLQGAFEEAKKHQLEIRQPEFIKVNGLQAIRYSMFRNETDSPVNASINYVVVGKADLVTLVFLTDDKSFEKMKKAAETMMATVNMPHETTPESWPESNAYLSGVHLTDMFVSIFKVAAICFGIVLIYRGIRNKHKKPSA